MNLLDTPQLALRSPTTLRSMRSLVAVFCCLQLLGCSESGDDDDETDSTGDIDVGDVGGDDIDPETGGDGDTSASTGNTDPGDGGATGEPGPYVLPDGFTAGELGGYQLGEEIEEGISLDELIDAESDEGCAFQILGVVRDFRRGDQDGGHPDFETYGGYGEKGILELDLGDDLKPIHAPGDHEFTTTESDFNQWYRNTPDVNRAYLLHVSFEPNGEVLTFQSTAFFPLDNTGFGNQEQEHNFGFSTEIHTQFAYNGGETFSFTGDDDLWVFINKKLAIDLGGLHPEQSDSVSIDEIAEEFGLIKGEAYSLDLFHAERHSGQSNFRIDTTLKFTDCGTVIDDGIIR
jgi:fibro-slime domain-containing protein